jgi:hypothetical protein
MAAQADLSWTPAVRPPHDGAVGPVLPERGSMMAIQEVAVVSIPVSDPA